MSGHLTYDTDVLVIGAGGAGFRAAVESASVGAKTLLVNKGKMSRSGATIMADSDMTLDGKSLNGMGYFGEPRDTKEKFFNDILTQGFFLNNQDQLKIYVDQAPDRVKEMMDWGLIIESTEERAIETPGHSMLDVLFNRAKSLNVEFLADVMITELLTHGKRVIGAVGLDLMTGDFIIIKAKAVVITTGGWHKGYDPNAGSRELSGDGVAVAYRAGATLGNMEFVTFCANIVVWPRHMRGSLFTYILHIVAGGPLYNNNGENIISKYDPFVMKSAISSEWNKCVLSNITYREVIADKGSEHGGIYYRTGVEGFDAVDKKINSYFPGWKYRGGDYSSLRNALAKGESIEIGPGAEYFEGGIQVDKNYKASMDGLYAAGESAMSLFGANRVVAATTEMVVTGAIAGKSAGEYAKSVEHIDPSEEQIEKYSDQIYHILSNDGEYLPSGILKEIRETSQKLMGPVRSREGIEKFLEFIRDIRNNKLSNIHLTTTSKKYNLDWMEAIELRNLVDVLEISAVAALNRTESRGVHYRSDFPDTDNDEWLREILIVPDSHGFLIKYNPVTSTYIAPIKGKYPFMEMIKKMMMMRSEITGGH